MNDVVFCSQKDLRDGMVNDQYIVTAFSTLAWGAKARFWAYSAAHLLISSLSSWLDKPAPKVQVLHTYTEILVHAQTLPTAPP